MKRLSNILTLCIVALLTQFEVHAQKPVIHKFAFDDSGIIQKLSGNGQWAVVTFGTADLQEMGKAKIVNVQTGEYVNLQTDEEIAADGRQTANDITNDGEIVVGSYKGEPAYWTKSTRQWTTLPKRINCTTATVTDITPDGKYAIGTGFSSLSEYFRESMMWNMETGTLINLTNLPTKDMSHENQSQRQFISISDDGRYILGSLSYSYLLPVAPCVFLYDRETSSAKFIGFDTSDTEDWKPWAENLAFIDEGEISANGKHIILHTWMYKSSEDGAAAVDGDAVAYYEVETGKFEVLTGSNGMYACTIDNNGTLYAGSPAGNPLREWSVYRNGYWYPISQILQQKYGIDFYTQTKYGNTGSVSDVTGDGKTLTAMVDPTGESYVMTLPDALGPLCDDINLLANYSTTPASGSTFSKLRSVEITFDRNVQFIGSDVKAATLTDSEGSLIRNSAGIAVSTSNKKAIVVTFRPQTLSADETYTITIPAGIISLEGDATKLNEEIKVVYNGRADLPVAAVGVYPKDGSTLAKIDNASNPIAVTFDSQIKLSETAAAELRLMKEDETGYDVVCSLGASVTDKTLYVYPTATQNLYTDRKYQVVISAGSVCDLSDNGGNEVIVLNYTGSYIREISHDNATLFKDDFSNQAQSLINYMRYEGDHLTPTTEMQGWGFDADNQPWNFSIHETTTSSDYCAASTSMYSSAGQSDDWMVIPQLEIPDEYVSLTFKAQSYLKSKTDKLKVLIWECEENINALSSDIIERFRSEAEVALNVQLSPGATEDGLTDEWTNYTIDLAKYSGKKIYIAFLNENNDQSAIFVDDISVMREMKFFVSLVTAESVVNQESIKVAGKLTANAEDETFTTLKLTLKDESGAIIDEHSATGLSLKKDDKYSFSFDNPLPLKKGVTNKCVITVELNNYTDDVICTIKNLVFKPVKRVVIEEMTGVTCGNCPQGILAMEKLKEIYSDLVIPVCIHTYTGDPFAAGLASYSTYLGLSAAPSAVIQRNGIISYPMGTDVLTGDYTFSNGFTLWKDIVAAEFETPADADVSAEYKVNEENGTFDLPVTIKYALDAKNLNLNVFVVMLEDGIKSYQENYFSANSDPAFGDWGVNGKYGQSIIYDYVHHDLARACWGTSYSGTAGLLPQSMSAGEQFTAQLTDFTLPENITNLANTKVVVMIVDGNTDKLINAVCVKPSGLTGINGVTTGSSFDITAQNGTIKVTADGDVTAQAYTPSGMLLAEGKGNNALTLDTTGYKGMVIVRAENKGQVTVKKIIM